LASPLSRWLAPRRPRTRAEAAGTPAPEELARAARILAVRTRREASGLFAGGYASAFRGGGIEFEESRPYVPGDDVRALDWNALARTGEPFVKRYREERDLTLLLALDVSASMTFGTTGRSKAARAAHAAGLLAAAAGRTGDRVGLASFADALRLEVAPARGPAHTWRLVRSAALESGAAAGGTRIEAGCEALLARQGGRGVSVVLSDFRDPALLTTPGPSARLRAVARRHELVCIALFDPREERIPPVGLVRLADPERPGRTLVLDSSSRRVRDRYRWAWAARRAALGRSLRAAGADVLWLRSDRDPLRVLVDYFRRRAARPRVVP
jgi:uncharacterized protein (DUF58 family)